MKHSELATMLSRELRQGLAERLARRQTLIGMRETKSMRHLGNKFRPVPAAEQDRMVWRFRIRDD